MSTAARISQISDTSTSSTSSTLVAGDLDIFFDSFYENYSGEYMQGNQVIKMPVKMESTKIDLGAKLFKMKSILNSSKLSMFKKKRVVDWNLKI